MNFIILGIVFLFISTINCSKRKQRQEDEDFKESPLEPNQIIFTKQQRVEQYLHTIQAFEAFNFKAKYELGKMIAMIINHTRLQKEGGSKKKTNAKKNVEADIIDHNPVESWRIAESYIKAYKDKENDVQGWKEIKTRLRAEPVYVRAKLAVRAIAVEEVNLLKHLVNEKYTYIIKERYDYAVRCYKEKGTENSEKIVDFIAKNNPELGAALSKGDKLKDGFDLVKVYDYINDNNFPMLQRALDQGFDPNFIIDGHGSLLGLSVVSGCHRCVKMLIERGADVNVPIQLDGLVRVKGWNQMAPIKGWTPLMIAVADGHLKIVAELIESGSALVSKTATGQEAERFHAREVARRIEDEEVKKAILRILILSENELRELIVKTDGKIFIEAIKSENMDLIDSFLLMRPNLDYSLEQIPPIKTSNESLSTLLRNECIKRN